MRHNKGGSHASFDRRSRQSGRYRIPRHSACSRRYYSGLASKRPKVAGLDKRIDGVDQRLGRMETRMDRIETRMDSLDGNLAKVSERLVRVETKLEGGHVVLSR
jgi:chromosome segregation ATPase